MDSDTFGPALPGQPLKHWGSFAWPSPTDMQMWFLFWKAPTANVFLTCFFPLCLSMPLVFFHCVFHCVCIVAVLSFSQIFEITAVGQSRPTGTSLRSPAPSEGIKLRAETLQ